ncbi:MAG: response regulator transcription factor, partial [Acidocella sp.]|nr:response regulator transcription factor [Acidocella sp.]
MRILLIEDEVEAAAYLTHRLTAEQHQVALAADGRAGLARCVAEDWDLLIIDRMLPGVDGLALLKAARAAGVLTPALFLTTLSGIDDRVDGLKAGGDDYLSKPYSFAELAARVEALGRRPRSQPPATILRVEDLEIDLLARTVRRGAATIDLQPREYQLLEFLARHAGQVVTRTMLLERVWDFHFEPQTNMVESHISRLRRKLTQVGGGEIIHTVRHAGYRLGTACV